MRGQVHHTLPASGNWCGEGGLGRPFWDVGEGGRAEGDQGEGEGQPRTIASPDRHGDPTAEAGQRRQRQPQQKSHNRIWCHEACDPGVTQPGLP